MEGCFFFDRNVVNPRVLFEDGKPEIYAGTEDGVMFEGSFKLVTRNPEPGDIPLGRIINNLPVAIPFFSTKDVQDMVDLLCGPEVLQVFTLNKIDGERFVKLTKKELRKFNFSKKTFKKLYIIITNGIATPEVSRTTFTQKIQHRKRILEESKGFFIEKIKELQRAVNTFPEYFTWLIARLDYVTTKCFKIKLLSSEYKISTMIDRPNYIERYFFLPASDKVPFPPFCADRARHLLKQAVATNTYPTKTILLECFRKVKEIHNLMSSAEVEIKKVRPDQTVIDVKIPKEYARSDKYYALATDDFRSTDAKMFVPGRTKIKVPAVPGVPSFDYAIFSRSTMILKLRCCVVN